MPSIDPILRADINATVTKRLDPAKYHISSTSGFVPTSPPPLTSLPDCFAAWDDLASRLPSLLQSTAPSALHDAVHDLPLLEASKLVDLRQLRRAYVVLGFLVHGLAWAGSSSSDGAAREVRIPPQLAQPYFEVCERLGMASSETLAYAGLCSWNWGFIDDDAAEEGSLNGYESRGDQTWEWRNLRCLVSFSGTRDEEVFYLVPVAVEKEAGEVIHALCEVMVLIQDAVADPQHTDALGKKVESVLTQLKDRVVKMQVLMKLLHEECDATTFWTQVRKYFAGGKGGPGWIFELADGTEVRRWCVGGSAAQCATFPFLDAVLGVKHERLGGQISVFEEMREYMPVEQRDFLTEVEQMKSLADFVEQNQQDGKLVSSFNDVLQEMAKWRSKHIGAVTTHIVNQARKEKKNAVTAEEVKDGLSVKDESDLQGTGGSSLLPFLKGARLDTEAAIIVS